MARLLKILEFAILVHKVKKLDRHPARKIFGLPGMAFAAKHENYQNNAQNCNMLRSSISWCMKHIFKYGRNLKCRWINHICTECVYSRECKIFLKGF